MGRYTGLRNFVKCNKEISEKWEKETISLDVDNKSDDYFIRRAVVLRDIPEFKPLPLQYDSYAEYLIRKKLYELQKEFYLYDLRNCAIRRWFYIRRKNLLLTINRIRIKGSWYKSLTL